MPCYQDEYNKLLMLKKVLKRKKEEKILGDSMYNHTICDISYRQEIIFNSLLPNLVKFSAHIFLVLTFIFFSFKHAFLNKWSSMFELEIQSLRKRDYLREF